MENFYFKPPINVSEERKWLLAVTSYELSNSVFYIADENNCFAVSIPGRWRIPNFLPEGIIVKQKNLLKLRSQNDIELHVEEVRRRGKKLKTGDKGDKLSGLDSSIKEKLENIKSANYHDIEDLVYRMELTYDEVMDVLDIKYFPTEKTDYTLQPRRYKKTILTKR